jgi:hypothetical protein
MVIPTVGTTSYTWDFENRGLAQSGSSASHLILNMTNVQMRNDAEERRCGDAEGNRLSKTAVQAGNPNPVSVLSQYSYDPIYELALFRGLLGPVTGGTMGAWGPIFAL